MQMELSLLDTDVVSEIIKQRNVTIRRNAAAYFNQHGQFAFSALTRFEIERGHKERRALRQLERFRIFCQHSLVVPVTESILDRAGDLWAFARQHGHPHGDADIAATAADLGRVLVSGNTAHFSWAPGIALADWRID